MTTEALLLGVFGCVIVRGCVTVPFTKPPPPPGKVGGIQPEVVPPEVTPPELPFVVGASVSNTKSRRFLFPQGERVVVTAGVDKFPCWLELMAAVVLEILEVTGPSVEDSLLTVVGPRVVVVVLFVVECVEGKLSPCLLCLATLRWYVFKWKAQHRNELY